MPLDTVNILLVEDTPGDARLNHEILKEGGFPAGNLFVTVDPAEPLAQEVSALFGYNDLINNLL